MCEREIVFQKKKIGKHPIENKPYFYQGFPLTKDSFPLTTFFCVLPNTEKYGKLSIQIIFQRNKQRVQKLYKLLIYLYNEYEF